ncbi:MAG: carbamoyltransferase [Planctomycetota bacterium]|jgi:carbamoyltransferase
MRVLGISAFHRDAAAALVVDGKVVAAVQEDRYTKRLQDESFPVRAIRACLTQGGIQARDLDRVVFYEKPLRKFERELASLITSFPKSSKAFSTSMFLWLGDRLWLKHRIVEELELPNADKVCFTEHQLAHAASAFYSSPHEEAAILTVDDAGEWSTTSLCSGSGNELKMLSEIKFPNSLGMLTSAFSQYLGFEPGTQDHLVENLASFGTPKHVDKINQLVQAGENGAYTINQDLFRFRYDHKQLFSPALEELLGTARTSGGALRFREDDTYDADLAASFQQVIEERTLALLERLHELVPSKALCFAGHLAQNRALCTRILRDGPFEQLYVPPAPHDAGAALGAALYVSHAVEGVETRDTLDHAFLGMKVENRPEDGVIELGGQEQTEAEMVTRLEAGERMGWIRGAHEFGAHSHGHRSILADPRDADSRKRLLGAVQQLEAYVPCGLAVPAECASEYFDLPQGGEYPLGFGQLAVQATDKLRQLAPSMVQPDGSAWPLVIHKDRDPEFHSLLHAFAAKTGTPLLAHSAFALRGSPIARIESDAVAAFLRTDLDCLIVEDRMYHPLTTTGLPPRPTVS